MIAPLLPMLAAVLAIARLDPTPAPNDLGTVIQQLANEFTSDATELLDAIDGAVINITRVAYITVLILGIFLYFTHLQRRLGRELIVGGIILAVLSEFVFPSLFNV
jgi:type IV secretory pathway TrbL component